MSPNFRKYVPLTFGAMTQVGGSGSSAEHEVSVNLRSRNCLFPKGWGRGGQETRDGSVTWAHRPVPGRKGGAGEGKGQGPVKSHVVPLAATTEPSGTEGMDQLYSDTHSGAGECMAMADWHWSF